MANIELLKNGDTEVIPRTTTQAVYMDDGTSFDVAVQSFTEANDELASTKNALESVVGSVSEDIAAQLNQLNETKASLKTAINGSGNTVGDKFSDYPVAISNGKALIAGAITDKGVSTSADDTFEEMEANIRAIQSSPVFETSIVQVIFDSQEAVMYCYQNGDFQVLNIYVSGEEIEVDKNSIFVMRVYSGAGHSGGGNSDGSISILDSLFPEDPDSNGAMAVALVEGDGSIYL